MGPLSLADRLILNPLFGSLLASDRADLARKSSHRLYEARQPVLRVGDEAAYVFVLLAGSVRVYHASADGVEAAVKFFKAPGVFGEIEVVAGVPHGENVDTLEESEILRIPRRVFLDVLDRN